MLGSLWLCESRLDCRRAGQLESIDGPELGIGGRWLRLDRLLPAAKSVSCTERDGRQNQ